MQETENPNPESVGEPAPEGLRPTVVPWPPAWLVEYEQGFAPPSERADTPADQGPAPLPGAAEAGPLLAGVIPAESPAGITPAVAAPAGAPPGPGQRAEDPVFFDLETRSALDLEEVGGRRYAQDGSTEIVSLVALWDHHVVVWAPLLEGPLPAEGLWPE